jgi:hypothetical protein
MIRVIHIKSTGHSGSTLLNLLLAQNKGIFAGGHLFRYARLWTKAGTQATTDGTLIQDSPFWQSVKNDLSQKNQTPQVDKADYRINAQDVENLFRAILAQSGCAAICDNSKAGAFDRILYRSPFQTFMVHMVRDGRAVSNSLREKGIFRLHTPLIWALDNLRIWILNRNKPHYMLVRYEDLVRAPEQTKEKIVIAAAKFFNIDGKTLKEQGQETIPFMFAGNRMRNSFDGTIEFDKDYMHETGSFRWLALSIMMMPALLVFQYRLTKNRGAVHA